MTRPQRPAVPVTRPSKKETSYVDAFMCNLQGVTTEVASLRFRPLPMRLGVARKRRSIEIRTDKQMAKIIAFYVPNHFRKNGKWIPQGNRGKVIEFNVPAKKSA
jgi:hypothetical protein